MADESLGHIDLRVISSSITKGVGGNNDDESPRKKAEKFVIQPLKNAEEAFKKFGTLKDVFTSITQGAGIRSTLREATGAAKEIGSGGALGLSTAALITGVAAIAGAVAVAAGVVSAIKSSLDYIKSRIDTLSKYNPALAMQGALDRLQDIRQSVQEASILQPLYVLVSQILREIKDLIFPLLLIIRLTITAILIPILSAISQLMKSINLGLLKVLQYAVSFLQSNPAAVPTSIGSILLGLFGFSPLGMSMAASAAVSTNNQMGNVIQALQDIIDLLQGKNKFNGNQWAINTLNALSVSSPVAPRLAPGGATSPWHVPMPSKVHP